MGSGDTTPDFWLPTTRAVHPRNPQALRCRRPSKEHWTTFCPACFDLDSCPGGGEVGLHGLMGPLFPHSMTLQKAEPWGPARATCLLFCTDPCPGRAATCLGQRHPVLGGSFGIRALADFSARRTPPATAGRAGLAPEGVPAGQGTARPARCLAEPSPLPRKIAPTCCPRPAETG